MINQWTALFCSRCSLASSYVSKASHFHTGALRTTPALLKSSNHCDNLRRFSSKTPPKSSSIVPLADTDVVPVDGQSNSPAAPPQQFIPHFSGFDIREVDESTRIKIHSASVELAKAQGDSVMNPTHPRHRKEILRMEEEEYAHTAILKPRMPLLDRRSENESFYMKGLAPLTERNHTDMICLIQADLDFRPAAIRRFLERQKVLSTIEEQKFNPKRNKILGNELALAHFLLARGAKIKFIGQKDWVTQYRKDAKPGVPEEDLPTMRFELCTLPTTYDPRFKVEAIDAKGVPVYYEALATFEKLKYLKWINFAESPHLDDWCLDKFSRIFSDTLEFIDLSGCPNISDRGIGTLHRCRNLKAIRVENLPHVEPNLEIVCAMLEDHLPNLQVLGIDYEQKTQQLRLEGEEMELAALEKDAQEEIRAITSGNEMSSKEQSDDSSLRSHVPS